MNKMQKTLIGLVGLMSSGAVFAANTALTSGENPITMLQCDQLANDIKLVLTKGVVGGIDCDTDANGTIVGISVCHTSGLTTERTSSVSPNNGTCPTGFSLNTAGTECIGTVTGASFPTATTAAGTVASSYPAAACSSANALTEAATAVTAATQ